MVTWRSHILPIEGELLQQIPLSRKEHHFLLFWRYGIQISIKYHRKVIPRRVYLLFVMMVHNCTCQCKSLNCVWLPRVSFNHLPCCYPGSMSEMCISDMNWPIIGFNFRYTHKLLCHIHVHTQRDGQSHTSTHTISPLQWSINLPDTPFSLSVGLGRLPAQPSLPLSPSFSLDLSLCILYIPSQASQCCVY